MTDRERFRNVLHFQDVDRIPNVEIGYWKGAIIRWLEEGLPADIPIWAPANDPQYTRNSRELTEYFGLDAHDIAYNTAVGIGPSTPRTVEVTDDGDYEKISYSDGYTYIRLKSDIEGSIHDIDWAVKDRSDWERVQDSIAPGWHNISRSPGNLPSEDRKYPAILTLPGFFWQLRIWMGFEKACTVFYEDPDWTQEIMTFLGDYLKSQCELVLEHFKPEYIGFDEDMSYNHGSMLAPGIIEKYLVPQYDKVTSYARSMGVDIFTVDSDGLNDEIIPVLYQGGVNTWLPFEMVCRQGQSTLLDLAKTYPWLRIFGGMDKTALSKGFEAIDAEIAKIRPLAERGGYIPMIDHKVPPDVSLENYKYYLREKTRALTVK